MNLETTKEMKTFSEQNELKGIFNNTPFRNENLLTYKEVSIYLKCHITTVRNWVNRGILKSYAIGNKIYFKMDDILNAFKEIKSSNNGK